jgi:hypothetical protein
MSYDLKRLLALVAVLGLAAACGKEGPPTPPLRAVPAPVKDLAVHQRGTHLLLSFQYPQTTPGGAALNGVSKVEIWEAVLPVTPPPPPAGTKPAAKGAATTPPAKTAPAAPATPEPLAPQQFAKLAKLRLTLAGKDLGAATLGNQLLIDLPLPELPPAPTATTAAPIATAAARDYGVRAFGPKGDRSELSNQVVLVPQVPPRAPEAVTVTGQADGILVEWKPVPDVGGYAIYRRSASERFSSKPLVVARPPETRYLDQAARFGQSYIYSVTAVDAKQPLVESAIQTEQEIHYVDRYPPPVPEDLVAVAEAGRARLVWQKSDAPDLAGYIVYRKGAAGGWARLTAKPIVATTYVDTTVAAGQAYDFRVTAIDQSGNESAPSAEVHVAVP